MIKLKHILTESNSNLLDVFPIGSNNLTLVMILKQWAVETQKY
jgi:hypothetical protein